MAPPGRRGGKFSKPTRGGGKHFSRDLQPLDKDGNPAGMWRDPADKEDSESEEEESEESSGEESEDEAGPATGAGAAAGNVSREQRKEEARKKKMQAIAKRNQKVAEVGDMPTSSSEEEDEGDLPANPNHSNKARAQARAVVAPAAETAPPTRKEKDNLSRREREAIEKEAARERYQKLHAEGKTDEAKADLARLRLIKQQREEATARKKAEQEERAEELKKREAEIDAREAKLKAAAMGDATAGRGAKKTRGKK